MNEKRTQAQVVTAQDELRSELVDVLGPELPGISGFGARFDDRTHEFALNVLVDSATTARRVSTRLPKQIGGIPIRVSRRGPAVFR